MVAGKAFGDISNLAFRYPDSFQAGGLHRHVDAWDELLSSSETFPKAVEVLDWIRKKVDV